MPLVEGRAGESFVFHSHRVIADRFIHCNVFLHARFRRWNSPQFPSNVGVEPIEKNRIVCAPEKCSGRSIRGYSNAPQLFLHSRASTIMNVEQNVPLLNGHEVPIGVLSRFLFLRTPLLSRRYVMTIDNG